MSIQTLPSHSAKTTHNSHRQFVSRGGHPGNPLKKGERQSLGWVLAPTRLDISTVLRGCDHPPHFFTRLPEWPPLPRGKCNDVRVLAHLPRGFLISNQAGDVPAKFECELMRRILSKSSGMSGYSTFGPCLALNDTGWGLSLHDSGPSRRGH